MEEDDLLGGDLCQEQDLHQKLQRGPEGEGFNRQPRGANNFGRGFPGDRDSGKDFRGYRGLEGNQQIAREANRGQFGGRDPEIGN